MAFAYSLEKVLELKRQFEDQRQLQLAQAEQARQEQVERLDTLLQLMEMQLEVKLTPDMIEQRGQYMASHLEHIQQARQTLKSATVVRDRAQMSLVEAAIDRKKFEKHRESSFQLVRQAENVLEQNSFDESATQVYLRQGR